VSIQTYNELLAAGNSWLHRADLAAFMPDFVSIAVARIGREVKARQMEQRVSTTPTSTVATLPSDFISMRAIRITGSTVGWLDFITPDEFFNQFPSTINSVSKKYTIFGDELVFPAAPTGDIELWYYKRLPELSTEVNALFTANPDLYLYGALAAAQPFLKDDKRVVLWEAQYASVRDSVNEIHRAGRYPTNMQIRVA
jgi:hypothetical protein